MTDQARRGRGRPPGAKNKPKPITVAPGAELESAEGQMLQALPHLMNVLVTNALENQDTKTAIYLVNRVLGKPTERQEVNQQTDQTIKIEIVNDWRKA